MTNVLGQEGTGWLRFSGDTYPQGEPQVSKDVGILRVPAPWLGEPFYSKTWLAVPPKAVRVPNAPSGRPFSWGKRQMVVMRNLPEGSVSGFLANPTPMHT